MIFLGLCQAFAKQLDRFGIGHPVQQTKAKETHEGIAMI